MQARRCGRLVLCALAVALATGCAQRIVQDAFDGPSRPDAEVATLTLQRDARLVSIDGEPMAAGFPTGMSEEDDPHALRVIRLLPGTHRVVVGVRPLETMADQAIISAYRTTEDAQLLRQDEAQAARRSGSAENVELEFVAAPGRTYYLAIDDSDDPSGRERWSATIHDTTGAQLAPAVSSPVGRVKHDPEASPPPDAG